jgi:hypothetical protein
MAPRKRKSIGRVNPNSLRMKLRAAETPQQRQARLEQNRTRNAEARAAETTEQRESRLEMNRTTAPKSRAAETTEQREYRLEMKRTTTAKSRETETAQHRRERLEENRELFHFILNPEQRRVFQLFSKSQIAPCGICDR